MQQINYVNFNALNKNGGKLTANEIRTNLPAALRAAYIHKGKVDTEKLRQDLVAKGFGEGAVGLYGPVFLDWADGSLTGRKDGKTTDAELAAYVRPRKRGQQDGFAMLSNHIAEQIFRQAYRDINGPDKVYSSDKDSDMNDYQEEQKARAKLASEGITSQQFSNAWGATGFRRW